MLDVRLTDRVPTADALALPVRPDASLSTVDAEGGGAESADGEVAIGYGAERVPADVVAFLAESGATGEAGSLATLPLPGRKPPVAYLVGIGKSGPDDLRKAGAAAIRAAGGRAEKGLRHLAVLLGHGAEPEAVRGLVEGLCLAWYKFSLKSSATQRVRRATVVVAEGSVADYQAALAKGMATAAATCAARDLINVPALQKSPAWLADQAGKLLAPLGVKLRIRTEQELRAEGFGGILAVGGGADRGPRLIEATWAPRGARGPRVVLVGKGITFDTGGLSLKPAEAMLQMKTDMAGGAAVLGALSAAATQKLPIRITALVPAAENALSGSAYRPSDVIRHYGGRTTEVLNTDAEGRLVLADALAYAVAKLRPDVLVDAATLTGAVRISLGVTTGGLFATDDALADQLLAAGEAAGESLWRLPLSADYEHLLESDVADANNAAGGPGAITAALFLRPFAGNVPWAHLDIAGAARAAADSEVITRGGTGFAVRTLTRWLEALAEQ
jgi:leucyl aminopeptidase